LLIASPVLGLVVEHSNALQQAQELGMRSTTLRVARAKRASAKSLPEKVGRHSEGVDTALPGKHTRLLYD